MTANNYYKNMNWKPQLGSVYCIMDKDTNKLDLFYEVAEIKVDKCISYGVPNTDGEYLDITYKVYDYRHTKNVNIYYVRLNKMFIGSKHRKQDLVIYFQHGHGENKLATHTITDARNPIVYKTAEDTQATRTKLKKLLINNVYLCKYNNFDSVYRVEKFYILYDILSDAHRFHDIIRPYKSCYDKLSNGTYEYDFYDYTKHKFNEMCYFKNIYDKLKNPNQDDEEDGWRTSDDDDTDTEEEDSDEEEVAEIPKVAEVAETDEEINMF